MSALDIVRGGGRSLDRRLARVSGEALLAALRAAGAVSEPEAAALGRPDGTGWARRLRALAAAKGDRTCRVLLSVLEGLEGPPRPGPFDFYDPQRDAAPGHRSDCPCCRPEPGWAPREEEEGPRTGEEGPEEEEGEPKNEEENPENDEGEPKNGDEGPEDDEEPKNGDEGPEDDEGGGNEGPEDDEEPKNDDEGPEDEDKGDEGPEDDEDEGDEGPDDDGGDEGGGDEGPGDDDDDGGDEGGGGDED